MSVVERSRLGWVGWVHVLAGGRCWACRVLSEWNDWKRERERERELILCVCDLAQGESEQVSEWVSERVEGKVSLQAANCKAKAKENQPALEMRVCPKSRRVQKGVFWLLWLFLSLFLYALFTLCFSLWLFGACILVYPCILVYTVYLLVYLYVDIFLYSTLQRLWPDTTSDHSHGKDTSTQQANLDRKVRVCTNDSTCNWLFFLSSIRESLRWPLPDTPSNQRTNWGHNGTWVNQRTKARPVKGK